MLMMSDVITHTPSTSLHPSSAPLPPFLRPKNPDRSVAILLLKYLSDDLERLQKRTFRIIFQDQHYKEALRNTNTPSLYDRRQELTTKLFKDIVNNPEHKLTDLLPPLNKDDSHFLRKNRKFNVPLHKRNRFRNSFITYNSNKFSE